MLAFNRFMSARMAESFAAHCRERYGKEAQQEGGQTVRVQSGDEVVVGTEITSSPTRLEQVGVKPSDVHIYLWDATTETFTFGAALWNDGSRTPAAQ